jgi:CRP/FNR family transcriptional regulator, anaerobic regulatory protein
MTSLEKYISSYFGVMQQQELELVGSFFKNTSLKKGEFHTKTKGNCDKLSFIQDGIIRIYAANGNVDITQWISTQGYFVTDLESFIFESPARWNIQALTDCNLYTIDRADYKKLGSLLPQWHQLEKLFVARCFAALEKRVFDHLSMTAEERYQSLFEKNKELFTQVPLQYIASMLGMKPETLSRVRKKALL